VRTDYKLDSVPHILSISLTQFRINSVCAERCYLPGYWANQVFFLTILSYSNIMKKRTKFKIAANKSVQRDFVHVHVTVM
jgi:hypothetical protein